MLSNSVVSGGFALLLLFLTSMHVGSQHAMVLCVICGFASWGANISTEMSDYPGAMAGYALCGLAAVTSAAVALFIVMGRAVSP